MLSVIAGTDRSFSAAVAEAYRDIISGESKGTRFVEWSFVFWNLGLQWSVPFFLTTDTKGRIQLY